MTLTKHRNGKQANVNMDTATLEKVDNYCLTLDISRSQFMRKAAASICKTIRCPMKRIRRSLKFGDHSERLICSTMEMEPLRPYYSKLAQFPQAI